MKHKLQNATFKKSLYNNFQNEIQAIFCEIICSMQQYIFNGVTWPQYVLSSHCYPIIISEIKPMLYFIFNCVSLEIMPVFSKNL